MNKELKETWREFLSFVNEYSKNHKEELKRMHLLQIFDAQETFRLEKINKFMGKDWIWYNYD